MLIAHCRRRKVVRGYTILELSLAVAISGLLVTAVIKGAIQQIENIKVFRVLEVYNETIDAVYSTYQSQSSYSGLSTRQMAALGAFTDARITNPRTNAITVTHPLGGQLSVYSVSDGALGPPLAWGMYFDQLPASSCGEVLLEIEPLTEAIAILPPGQTLTWPTQVTFNAAAMSFSSTNSGLIFLKNSNTRWSPSRAGIACSNAGPNFALLAFRVKVK